MGQVSIELLLIVVWLILGYWGTVFTYAWVSFVTYVLIMLFLWRLSVLAIC